MAFSRPEDRDVPPVSVSCSTSTFQSLASPHSHLAPREEKVMVDADAIEQWLMSPKKPESTETFTKDAAHTENTSKQSLADVTAMRRRRQQMQQKNHSSPSRSSQQQDQQNETLSKIVDASHTSFSRSKSTKEWQHLGPTHPNPMMEISTMEKVRHKLSSTNNNISVGTINSKNICEDYVIGTSPTLPKSTDYDKNSADDGRSPLDPLGFATKEEMSNIGNSKHQHELIGLETCIKNIRKGHSVAGIREIRRRRQQRLQRREIIKNPQGVETEDNQQPTKNNKKLLLDDSEDYKSNGKETQNDHEHIDQVDASGDSFTDNSIALRKMNRDEKDSQKILASRTKKIHLLKRHGAADGKSPILKPANLSGGLDHNKECVSKINKLRTIRLQIPEGNDKNSPQEGEEYYSSKEFEHSYHQRGEEFEDEISLEELCRDFKRKTEIPSSMHSTKKIKDALARARSQPCRAFTHNSDRGSPRKDPKRRGDQSDTETLLQNESESENMSFLRALENESLLMNNQITEGGYIHNKSQECEDESSANDDDGVIVTTSASGISSDGDNFSESNDAPSEIKQVLHNTSSFLDSETNSASRMGHESDDVSQPCVENCSMSTSLNKQNQKALDTTVNKYDVPNLTISTLAEATIGASSAMTRNQSEMQTIRLLRKSSRIKLHVYDLVADDTQLDLWGCHFPLGQVFNAFNSSLHSIGTGAYHVGLEINGIEYAYGANTTKGLTGIFTCAPKKSPGYQFRTTIDFGDRMVLRTSSDAEFMEDDIVDGRQIVREMMNKNEYLGTEYDLLRKNCCVFAYDVCIRLGINEEEIPSWFHNLAAVGAQGADAANFTLSPITKLFNGNELEIFSDYLNETSLTDNLDAIQDTSSRGNEIDDNIDNSAYQF